MNYRLTKRELRIIERTKRGMQNGDAEAPAPVPDEEKKVTTAQKVMPYVYFALTFIIIAVAIRLFAWINS